MKRITAFAFLAILAGLVYAQFRGPEVVTVKPFLDVDKVRQGSEFRVALIVQIKEGYHIQASKPPEGFIAT
jgi:hypothetical protein